MCDSERFSFASTDELPYNPAIIGQERAVEAIHFGLDIRAPGFNVFVMGPAGTGRRSILQRLVREQAGQAPVPDDWVYVSHLTDPGNPLAIRLAPGQGRRFRGDMERFSSGLLDRLGQAFETEDYAEAREALAQRFRLAQQEELAAVDMTCRERGFALVRSPSGLTIAPVRDGELLSSEAMSQLPAEERAALDQHLDDLRDRLNRAMRRLRELERETQSEIERLDREVASFTVAPLLQELQARYGDFDEIVEYLDEVRQDIVEHVGAFRQGNLEDETGALLAVPVTQRYRVNLLVDRADMEGAPVIVETSPTYDKLFGCVEYDVRSGATSTDHTLIRAGALHRANGGYLILDAASLLSAPRVWDGLKRALFDGVVRVESPDGQQLVRAITPVPEPIPLQVKVVLQGSPGIYYALYDHDADFAKLFKVLADFNSEMDRTPEAEESYAQFVRSLCQDEGLRPFTPEAVARVVEYGARLAEHQERLSTHFGVVADLAREASYWARQKLARQTSAEAVRRADVVTALQQQRRRASLPEHLAHLRILEGEVVIATEDARVGQVNGLSVIRLGNYDFGVPHRITARVYVGRGNVLDIHREIDMGGPIHHKGLLTLVGYFGGQYGLPGTLSMEASLSFEQVYDDIDGDSASSAELYALISALAEVPLRQDLAVTGAVDQYGGLLPIGGVNEKIEGFFEICRRRGLSGTQGVLIPATNARHLMLDDAVIDAVRAGQFHIYPVVEVDEGIALLTGEPAGERDEQGRFTPGSIHAAVAAQLKRFAERADGEEEEEEV